MKKLLALILVLVTCLSLFACGKKEDGGESSPSGAEAVAKEFVSVYNAGDAEGFLAMIHEKLQQSLFEESGMDRETFIETFEASGEIAEQYGMVIKAEFVRMEEMDAEEKEELKNELKEEYDLEMTDACKAIIKMTVGSDVTEDGMPMVQIDGKWYLCGTP